MAVKMTEVHRFSTTGGESLLNNVDIANTVSNGIISLRKSVGGKNTVETG